MLTVSDFYKKYRHLGVDTVMEKYQEYRKYFSVARLSHQNREFNGWMENKESMLREKYANPNLFHFNMKPDFFFLEYVH